jgi:hypothetical protein
MLRTIQKDLLSVSRLMNNRRVVPQLKLFRGNDPLTVEREVNAWLRETEALVVSVEQSQCEHGGRLVFIISVLYAC